MDKKRLSRIMAKADPAAIAALAGTIRKEHDIVVIKAPGKTLAMVKMREPVKSSQFYIGEVIVTEAVVGLDGARGIAVVMGDDFEKTLNMAIIDAACNRGVFAGEAALLELERAQLELEQKENAMHLKTMVRFNSMDTEAQK
ncbi:alpha-D-ribose 1-methylphosphonate 5-triphosphate synthase subunit PhnG [Sporobacter termitidis DSM 10068]|uniref:Alpha-D-ribose 1-methylphosphonate 5-triphosphate synthase subunit PhnG n=1 Tax=Sporobacter termitidis DSM 10068 TaxID=1123282 RepID=A0A1M5Z7J1_9FIRM|nr:phosphonate C-P lyase system protein PhnG [Sporobacter termitidis]SHI20205.1 alpha-D-ribose 1-methylphosphonate 5-triphosphate synthase subunit PhnG [Sporobacter termitidis DSM 10068]